MNGINGGILWFIIYSSYAIAFGYGMRLFEISEENGDENYTPAVLLIVRHNFNLIFFFWNLKKIFF